MTRFKPIFAVVLAVAIVAGSASAQTSLTQDVDGNTANWEQVVEILRRVIRQQQSLIDKQQSLINEQEALLNAYRCMFEVDIEVVPGGCPDSVLSETEIADGTM